jgi:hypothetical protein
LNALDVIVPEISRFPNASVNSPEDPDPEEYGTPFKNIPAEDPPRYIVPAEFTLNPPDLLAKVWATRPPEASTIKVFPVFLNALDVIVPEISRLPNASVDRPEDPEPEENGTPFKKIPVEPVSLIFPAASTLKPPDWLAKVGATNVPVFTARLPATVTIPPLVTFNILLRFMFPNVSRDRVEVVNDPGVYKEFAVIAPPAVIPLQKILPVVSRVA